MLNIIWNHHYNHSIYSSCWNSFASQNTMKDISGDMKRKLWFSSTGGILHKHKLKICHGYWSLFITPKATIHCYLAISTTSTLTSNQFHAMMHCDMSHLWTSKCARDPDAVGVSTSFTFVHFHDVICDYFLVLKFNINPQSQTLFINRHITFRLWCRWFW